MRVAKGAPIINAIVAEVQLIFGGTMHAVTGAHSWSEENHVCDANSHLAGDAALPPELAGA